ncbi:MAG: radical SAM protein [Deltaproteobacteria bacterium]|nr:radical SAM protein [Deltaproteobacteria bacterium]
MRLGSVILEVTPRCNLDCRDCYNVWKRPEAPQAPAPGFAGTLRTLKRLFQQAEVGHVSMSGGEPLLVERLPELVLFCRLQGASVNVITNGNSGSREQYRTLVELGVSLFELPVHSHEPGPHEAMTGKVGSWTRSVESVRTLHELGGNVVAALVLTALNASSVAQTLEMIRELGVKRVMLNRFNVGGRGIEESEALQPSREQMTRAFADANAAACRLGLRVTSNVCTPHCVLDPLQYRNITFPSCGTDVATRPLALEAGGNLRFCNHSPTVLGSIHEGGLEPLLQGATWLSGGRRFPRDAAPARRGSAAGVAAAPPPSSSAGR